MNILNTRLVAYINQWLYDFEFFLGGYKWNLTRQPFINLQQIIYMVFIDGPLGRLY